jgi:hypothetical protein
MRFLPFLLLAVAPAALAAPITISDPWGVGAPDVVGANSSFDIQKGVFDFGSTSATIKLYFNFGPDNTSLAPFALGSVTLSLGDLFISGGGVNYGIALVAHNTAVSGDVAAGTLYQINNSNGQLTASQALGNPSSITYRPNEIVWLRNDGAGSITPVAVGSVSVQSGGDGVINPEFVVTLNLTYSSTIGAALASPSIHFASATCGNDVLDGQIPEPGSLSLIGGGLLLAAGIKFHRRNRETAAK